MGEAKRKRIELEKQPTLGDKPVEDEYVEGMKKVAAAIDEIFNGDKTGDERTTGFILMIFPFGSEEGRTNYISNCERKDVIVLLKEQLARFEGQPEISGRA